MPKYQMLINYVPGEECRIAIVADGRLEELYQERTSLESHVGNIYKAKVTNIEPSIQAAFVDFGLERNGFLHITDLHPKYFPGDAKELTERVGHKTPHRDRPPIQKCLHRGQEILIQVLKEGIGTKGPTVTSYLSIPGRYLVMMPHMERLGVSRKVEDDDVRREMRKVLDTLELQEGFGFIVRTAGIGKTKTDLKRDLAYLQRLWKTLDRRRKSLPNVGELYTESDLVIRTLRDVYTTDIHEVIIDNPQAARRAHDFLSIISPRAGARVLAYKDPVPLFHRYGIENQIELINSREVPLPSGGSLVIDSTEALVAIDVNSGKSRNAKDAEMNAYQTNIEATDEICRQLRLRDLGGVVVNDLIDMRETKHRRAIEQRFRNNLKNDRARTRINTISQFGILEMTRQRMRPSLKKSIYVDCPTCDGRGHTKSTESVLLHIMRRLALVLHNPQVAHVELTISPDVAFQLLNRKRSELSGLENRYGKSVTVRVSGGGSNDFIELAAFDHRQSPVKGESLKGLKDPILVPAKSLADSDLVEEEVEDDVEQEVVEQEVVENEPKREVPPTIEELMAPINGLDDDEQADEKKSRKRRRRGGRGRGKSKHSQGGEAKQDRPGDEQVEEKKEAIASEQPQDKKEHDAAGDEADKQGKSRGRRRGGRGRRKRSGQSEQNRPGDSPVVEKQPGDDKHEVVEQESIETSDGSDGKKEETSQQRKSRRRRRGRKQHKSAESEQGNDDVKADHPPAASESTSDDQSTKEHETQPSRSEPDNDEKSQSSRKVKAMKPSAAKKKTTKKKTSKSSKKVTRKKSSKKKTSKKKESKPD